jgi:hypothetical protein
VLQMDDKLAGPAWGISGLQIWKTVDDPVTKGFSLLTSDGPINFYGSASNCFASGRNS